MTNVRKRKESVNTTLNVFDQTIIESDLPVYVKKELPKTFPALLDYEVPTDKEMLLYYLRLLYLRSCEVLNKNNASNKNGKLNDDVLFTLINERYMETYKKLEVIQYSIRDRRSGMNKGKYIEYNIAVAGGVIGYQALSFLCLSVTNSIQKRMLRKEGSKYPESYIKTAIEWSISNRLFIVPEDDPNLWTQTECYRQLYHLSGRWKYLSAVDEESFMFFRILEDRLFSICLFADNGNVLDGPEGSYVDPPSGGSKNPILRASYEFIDNVSCICSSIDEYPFIMDRLNEIFNMKQKTKEMGVTFEFGMIKYIKERNKEPVIKEYLDETRMDSIHYEEREGEKLISTRRNRGTSLRKIKWTFYKTRPYLQVSWLMTNHSFKANGTTKCVYPSKWQYIALCWHQFNYLLGGMNIQFNEDCVLRKGNFWEGIQDQVSRDNPFIIELMGTVMVVSKSDCYICNGVYDAQVLWCYLFSTVSNFIYKTKDRNITASRMKNLLKEWEKITLTTGNGERSKQKDDFESGFDLESMIII